MGEGQGIKKITVKSGEHEGEYLVHKDWMADKSREDRKKEFVRWLKS